MVKQQVQSAVLNLLITEYCNQSCPFCFASKEMKNSHKKIMTFEQFKLITKMAKRDGIVCLALIGGEPTIHPGFIEIMKYASKQYFYIYIATNGIFPKKVKKYLLKTNPNQLNTINVNISTPGFVMNPKIREQVLEMIDEFTPKFNLSLVITNRFLDWKLPKQIIDLISPSIIKKVIVTFGMEGCELGNYNYTTIENFPKIGVNLFQMLKYLEVKKPRGIMMRKLTLPCMFNSKQLAYLKDNKYINPIDYACHPTNEKRDLFINPSLETFSCYPLAGMKKKKITPTTDLVKLVNEYSANDTKLRQQYVLPYCQKCPFYGFKPGQCSGPCPSFTLNALRPKQKFKNLELI